MSDINKSLMKQIDDCTALMNCWTVSDLMRIRGDTDVCHQLASRDVGFTDGIWLSAYIEGTNSKDMAVCSSPLYYKLPMAYGALSTRAQLVHACR